MIQIAQAGTFPRTFRELTEPARLPYKFAIIRNRWRETKNKLANPPDTCPFYDAWSINPFNDGKGEPIPIFPPWWEFIRAINNDAGYTFCRSVGAMIINNDYEQSHPDPNPPPVAECLGCGSNFLAFAYETVTHICAVSFNYRDTPPDPQKVNWYNTPYLVWKAGQIAQDGHVSKVGNGVDAFWPYVSRTGFWVNKKYLYIFPTGPNYQFRGTDIYDGNRPLMLVQGGRQVFYDEFSLGGVKSVIPPV